MEKKLRYKFRDKNGCNRYIISAEDVRMISSLSKEFKQKFQHDEEDEMIEYDMDAEYSTRELYFMMELSPDDEDKWYHYHFKEVV